MATMQIRKAKDGLVHILNWVLRGGCCFRPSKEHFIDKKIRKEAEELRLTQFATSNKTREEQYMPRYVVEENGEQKIHRGLEKGEFVEGDGSKLFSLFTSISNMQHFGIGVCLYFHITTVYGCVLLVCAVISSWNAVYFNSKEYSQHNPESWEITDKFTAGSAVCTDVEAVCTNSECSTTDDQLQCPVGYELGIVNVIIIAVIAIALVVVSMREEKESDKIDVSEQTAQDYSIIVEDPDQDAIDPDEWRDFFGQWGKVFSVTTVTNVNDGQMLRLAKRYAFVEREIELEREDLLTLQKKHLKKNALQALKESDKSEDELAIEWDEIDSKAEKGADKLRDLDNDALLEATMEAKSKFKGFMERIGLDKTIGQLEAEKKSLVSQMDELVADIQDTNVAKVLVTFNEEKSQRNCLEDLSVGLIPAILNWDIKSVDGKKLKFRDTNLLAVREAPEPEDIIYENLGIDDYKIVLQQCLTYSILICMLAVAFFLIRYAMDESAFIASLIISGCNSAFPTLNKMLIRTFEKHRTYSDIENSYLWKTILARWFTSVIIVYIVAIMPDEDGMFENEVLKEKNINQIGTILIFEVMFNPFCRLLDPMGNFNRFVKGPLSGTSDRAEGCQLGTRWMLAERFTDLNKLLMMIMMFTGIFPLGYWFGAAACFVAYWVDKFCILRLFRINPPVTNDRLTRISQTTYGVILLIHCIATTAYYYSWPFDNLCEKKK